MTSKEVIKKARERTGFPLNVECSIITDKELKIIERDLEVLECFKKYFDFKLVFENNQTFLIFKSKERYLPVDSKISVPNKYYEPLKRWLENE